jgi:hypothetical protein
LDRVSHDASVVGGGGGFKGAGMIDVYHCPNAERDDDFDRDPV